MAKPNLRITLQPQEMFNKLMHNPKLNNSVLFRFLLSAVVDLKEDQTYDELSKVLSSALESQY
jgi:hypothetical protein